MIDQCCWSTTIGAYATGAAVDPAVTDADSISAHVSCRLGLSEPDFQIGADARASPGDNAITKLGHHAASRFGALA